MQFSVLRRLSDISIAAGNTRCTENISSSEAVQQNVSIVMTCSITYRGNWAPVMRWFVSDMSHNFTDDDITSTTSNTTVTSQLTVMASADLHGSRIICRTYFTQPSISLQTNATNIPSYTYEWTSPTINIGKLNPAVYSTITDSFSVHLSSGIQTLLTSLMHVLLYLLLTAGHGNKVKITKIRVRF